MKLAVFTLNFLISISYAAPMPATSTSILASTETGYFFSRKGFQIGTAGSNWKLGPDKGLSKTDEDTSWAFRNTGHPSARAHLKMDELKTEMGVEALSKRWVRDYSPFGFDVLGTKLFLNNGTKALLIDSRDPKNKIQLRQAIFVENKKMFILTCSDQTQSFNQTIADCNRLIKNFSLKSVSHPTQKSF